MSDLQETFMYLKTKERGFMYTVLVAALGAEMIVLLIQWGLQSTAQKMFMFLIEILVLLRNTTLMEPDYLIL